MSDKVKYDLSGDKRTVTIYRETEANTELIQSAWLISEDDPPGKAVFKILIEGKVEQRFEFEIKK